jgi:hypothetical protein
VEEREYNATMRPSHNPTAVAAQPMIDNTPVCDRLREAVEQATVRARPGRLSGLRVSHSESVLYGGFIWARRAPNI